MREGSWGRHVGGSREEPAKDIAKVAGPVSGGCENPHSADPLRSSRVTKIPVKRIGFKMEMKDLAGKLRYRVLVAHTQRAATSKSVLANNYSFWKAIVIWKLPHDK